jgi:hypothetical protein
MSELPEWEIGEADELLCENCGRPFDEHEPDVAARDGMRPRWVSYCPPPGIPASAGDREVFDGCAALAMFAALAVFGVVALLVVNNLFPCPGTTCI